MNINTYLKPAILIAISITSACQDSPVIDNEEKDQSNATTESNTVRDPDVVKLRLLATLDNVSNAEIYFSNDSKYFSYRLPNNELGIYNIKSTTSFKIKPRGLPVWVSFAPEQNTIKTWSVGFNRNLTGDEIVSRTIDSYIESFPFSSVSGIELASSSTDISFITDDQIQMHSMTSNGRYIQVVLQSKNRILDRNTSTILFTAPNSDAICFDINFNSFAYLENDAIKIHDINSLQVVKEIKLPGVAIVPDTLTFSPDGHFIGAYAVKGGNPRPMIFSLATQQIAYEGPISRRPKDLAFSPGGKYLTFIDNDHLHIWDFKNPNLETSILKQEERDYGNIAFDQNSKYIVLFSKTNKKLKLFSRAE